MAVLPTPGSPIRAGLFLVRRERIWITRSISVSRPMMGSSLLALALAVRSTPIWSMVGVRDCCLPPSPVPGPDWETTWITWERTFSRLTPRLSRTPAAIPSPSRTSPSRRCSVPMWLWLRRRASSTESSITFLARGVREMSPITMRSPRPMMNSTALRTLLSSTPRLLRTLAAIPSPSRTSPSRRCSVPM